MCVYPRDEEMMKGGGLDDRTGVCPKMSVR